MRVFAPVHAALAVASVLVVGGTGWAILLGCVQPAKYPIAPTATPIEIDLEPVLGAQKGVLRPPEAPALPKLNRIGKDEFIDQVLNRAPEFDGPKERLITVSGNSSPAVGVIGAIELVGALNYDRVGKYVTDAFYTALQSKGTKLVDLEYLPVLVGEAKLTKEGDAHVAGPAELAARIGQLKGCDLIAFVHLVKDNRFEARPERFQLPLRLDEADWARYQDDLRRYDNAYANYVASVETYNRAIDAFVGSAAAEIKARASSYDSSYATYLNDVSTYNAQSQYYISPVPKSPLSWSLKDPRGAGKDPLAGEVKARLGEFTPIRLEPAKPLILPRKPEEVLPPKDAQSEILATVYQFSMSVRVVDVQKRELKWFGVVAAQNVSQVKAVKECCQMIADRLVAQN